MQIQGLNISLAKVVLTLGVCLFLVSCAKSGLDQSSDAALVLGSSSFNPGDTAPGVNFDSQNTVSAFQQSQNTGLASVSILSALGSTTDSGYIPQNSGNQNGGNDTGSIPAPVTATTTTVSPVAQNTTSGTQNTNPASQVTPPSSSTGSSGSASPSSNPGGTVATDGGSTSSVPQSPVAIGGTDSGNIPGPGTVSGNDTGNVPASNSGGAIPSTTPVTTLPLANNGSSTPSTAPVTTVPVANNSGGSSQPSTPVTTVPVADNGNISPSTTPVTTVPVADNGNISPSTTPVTTVPVADNGNISPSTTPVTTVPVVDNHSIPDGSCSCTCHNPAHVATSPCHSKEEKVTIELGRVCSVKRSKSENLFFEEAKNPILSIEAIVPQNKIKYGEKSCNPYSNPGVIQQWGVLSADAKERILIASYPLKGIPLDAKKYQKSFSFNLKELKKKLGIDWSKAAIVTSVCDDLNGDGSCYKAVQKDYLSVVPGTFKANRIPKKIALDVWNGRGLSQALDDDKCDKQYSPIVLDLTGQGIELSPPEEGVQFDLNADGNPVYTGWVKGANNAFLVRDIKHNGKIEDGSELFGSATLLKNGKRAANGFEALKDLDENHDGILNASDSAWRDLRLWFDKNQDGVSQPSELENLSSYGIQSINLNYVELLEMDDYGNQTRERSTYIRKINRQEKPLLMVDIWFRTLIEQ